MDDLIDAAHRTVGITKYSVQVTADRLDEGYEPDPIGVSILTGLVYAFDKLSAALPNTATTVFLRDNIFRAIQLQDPDYSRNIEGDVLRLHWDEYHLFNMICNRIKGVLGVQQEKNLRIWDRATARDLSGMDGFRRCLRLTLYRPRDLMVLLNNAFNHAQSHGRDTIVNEDIEATSREVSCSRLDDLKKEYGGIIPGISRLLGLFAGGSSAFALGDVAALLPRLTDVEDLTPAAGQTFALIQTPEELVHNLYSVGFLGVWRPSASSYVFCHDGKAPDFLVDAESKILIHPCYWIALNLRGEELQISEIEEIHDEYDIEVCSETPEIRKRKLGQVIGQLNQIEEGDSDAAKFEEWCLQAIRIVFAAGIVNAELHPNRDRTQRRDVIGRNTGATETWKRILEDHKSRQVVFEAKNFSRDLGPPEYRQMLSYLSGEHGKLGFIINRSSDAALESERELQWVREMYHEHEQRVIIKIPTPLLVSWLSKLRNPQKHDAPDKSLGALLDTYERMYLRLGGVTPKRKKRKK
ncbi:MAG: ATP-binding protein [Lentisphaerae bacterium]|nr:ATP-binding protein [Lentisphaerota bacterium]